MSASFPKSEHFYGFLILKKELLMHKQRGIQNTVKNLSWSFLQNSQRLKAKSFIIDIKQSSEYASDVSAF